MLFLDDDVLFQPDLIRHHLENYEGPSIGAVNGRIMYDGAQKNDEPWAARLDPQRGLPPELHHQPTWEPTCTLNMSIRKKVLQEVRDFDLNYWGNFLWEEVDYALQIRKKGYRIQYEPRAEVFHVMVQQGGSRNPTPGSYLESTVFNDWYFFLNIFPRATGPACFTARKGSGGTMVG